MKIFIEKFFFKNNLIKYNFNKFNKIFFINNIILIYCNNIENYWITIIFIFHEWLYPVSKYLHELIIFPMCIIMRNNYPIKLAYLLRVQIFQQSIFQDSESLWRNQNKNLTLYLHISTIYFSFIWIYKWRIFKIKIIICFQGTGIFFTCYSL